MELSQKIYESVGELNMTQRNDQEAQQAVQIALNTVTTVTSEALIAISEKIKTVLNTILQSHYEKNHALAKLAAKDPLNPLLAQNAGDIQPFVSALQNMHAQLAETNQAILRQNVEAALTSQGTLDPGVAARLQSGFDEILHKTSKIQRTAQLNAFLHPESAEVSVAQKFTQSAESLLDKSYKLVETAKKLSHQQALLSGSNPDPGQAKALAAQMDVLNKHCSELKQAVKQTKEEQYKPSSPRP